MKATPRTSLVRFVVTVGCVFLALAAHAPAHSSQTRMHAALDALRAAKTSANPVEDLKTAKGRLGVAIHNKAGYRAEAIGLVDEAIAEFQAGHRREAYKLVDQAIEKAEKGVTAGYR